nr:PREDICTED: uncharacterized protein LOC109037226 [Bemisia tabaci]
MFRRILKIKDAVTACVALLNITIELPTDEEWKILENACESLEIFDEISQHTGSEQRVTLFELNLMLNGLRAQLARLYNSEELPETVRNMVKDLSDGIKDRFGVSTTKDLYNESMLLDPRFKKDGFNVNYLYEETITRVQNKLKAIPHPQVSGTDPQSTTSEKNLRPSNRKPSKLFEPFDEKVEEKVMAQTRPEAHIIELHKFLSADNLRRDESPLKWWRKNRQLTRGRLCIPATSVPSETIFSKCGLTITQRRNCLKPSKVAMLIFLKVNW